MENKSHRAPLWPAGVADVDPEHEQALLPVAVAGSCSGTWSSTVWKAEHVFEQGGRHLS